MRNALVIHPDGLVHGIDLGENGNEEYDALSKAIGGFLQMVPLGDSDLLIWCDDEGKLKSLEYNEKATKVWTRYWGQTDVMVGPCVITGGVDWDSDCSKGLTPEQVVEIERLISG